MEKKDSIKKLIKRGDVVVIAALLVLSAVLFVVGLLSGREAAAYATVSVSGEQRARLPLDTDTTVEIEGYGGMSCTVEIADGRARIVMAECPDKVCVNDGWIDSAGEVIVCLPARVTVQLSAQDSELDAVSR